MRRPSSLCLLAFAATAAAVALGAARAEARALVVMVGDSTTWGGTSPPYPAPVGQSPAHPGRVLAALLAMLPESSAWHDGEVLNLGIPGTTTRDWVETFPEHLCQGRAVVGDTRLLDAACERRVPLADAVATVAGRTPDAVLVLLGTNDILKKIPPAETVENLARLRDRLPPAPIHIAPPFSPPAPPGTEFAAAVRSSLIERGLMSGPDWPRLPTVDGIHLTEGGYAAAAALWLDVLRKQKP